MPKMDHNFFIDAVKKTVKDNLDFIPPMERAACIFVRPFGVFLPH